MIQYQFLCHRENKIPIIVANTDDAWNGNKWHLNHFSDPNYLQMFRKVSKHAIFSTHLNIPRKFYLNLSVDTKKEGLLLQPHTTSIWAKVRSPKYGRKVSHTLLFISKTRFSVAKDQFGNRVESRRAKISGKAVYNEPIFHCRNVRKQPASFGGTLYLSTKRSIAKS